MSHTPVAWRPASERDLEIAGSLFADAFADWQVRWFARPGSTVDEIVRLPGGTPAPNAPGCTSFTCAPGVRLDLFAHGERRLIEAAYPTGGNAFDTLACRDLLASIAAEIRDDLIGALRSALTAPGYERQQDAQGHTDSTDSFSGYGAISLTLVSPRGGAFATLICDIRHVWNQYVSPTTRTSDLLADRDMTPRRVALDSSPITLSVLLGRCELSAAQLTTLSPGDVVVLDRRLDAPAALLIDETSSLVAFGTPGRTGTSLSFKLTSLTTPDAP